MVAFPWLEYATAQDPARNYCLWDYRPPQPAADKWRAVNVLFKSFESAGCLHSGVAVVEALRAGIGAFQTVFGVKWINGVLGWEYYFYDYRRRARQVSISKTLTVMAPFAKADLPINEDLPYFMFSLDFQAEGDVFRPKFDVVHMYIGHPDTSVSSGIAYGISTQQTRLENFYFFFNAKTQMQAVAAKVASSAYFDETTQSLDHVLLPELRTCQTICVANKQTHDAIYFSGIDVHQLLWFLQRFSYPADLVAFVCDHRDQFDHVLFDVGIDYASRHGRVRYLKSGFYGNF